MKWAIFSDIHGNFEALQEAISETERRALSRYAVLGDTVGYGANPNECLEWVLDHAEINLAGNHEKAVTDLALRDWFNPEAKEALIWTAGVLKPSLKEKMLGLQYMKVSSDTTFVHSSPREPESFPYILDTREAGAAFQFLQTRLCFCGHTHIPGCFCESEKSSVYLRPGILRLNPKDRYILNPGSIGQPRDGDSRLSFGLFDDKEWTFEIVRLEYNNKKAADKIRKAGLPKYLAERLL